MGDPRNPVNSTTMITSLFYLIFLLSALIVNAADPAYYKFTEHFLLNCGASTNLNSSDGQSWDGDAGTKLSPDISTASLSSPATTDQDSSITSPVPYLTARIIHSKFSYIFPLSPGQKILRLYFYPAAYSTNGGGPAQSFDKTQSFFGVTANQYTLLANFSAYLTASDMKPQGITFFVKEFIVNVQQTQAVNLTFLPSPDSYAFINGIEVVSIPENFYMGSHDMNHNPLRYVNFPNSPYQVDQNVTAFETLYRLNVGGGTVTGDADTGMFREWLQDDSFLSSGIGNPLNDDTISLTYTSQTPNYSAPTTVYRTNRAMGTMANQTPAVNLTWNFQVDTGFFYLFRLHFCEFQPELFFKNGQRIFTVFIGNLTAEEDVDVIHLAGGTGIPMFRDYVIFVANPTGGKSKQDLLLALAPARKFDPTYFDAYLNGLEIFRLNSTDSNLAGVNPDLLQVPPSSSPNSQPGKKKKKSSVGMIAGVVGGVAGAGAIIFLMILFIIGRRRRGTKDFDGKSATKSSWAPLSTQSKSTMTGASDGSSPLPSDLCRRFLLDEIKTATSDFDPALVIGTGGFGKVYRGYVDNSLTAVGIKRLDTTSRQGVHEFRTEIEMLSNLRHVHLVSLIGYCDENKEMILVYDYMSNGTLRDHLYRTENPRLTWKQRLQVSVGAARGLHYLHSGAKHSIIHRDVKSTNILLDEKLVAKVSDFGLSKLGPTSGHQSHVSTVVKGSFGYVDPEYYKKQQLTEKSDVYSFGVVLFEVLCARPAIVPTLPREQVNLAEWARRCNKKGTIDQMVDANLRDQIAPECLKSFSDIAISCLKDQGSDRPAMGDIVWSLEFALQLQEAADKYGDNHEHPIIFAPFSPEMDATTTSTGDNDTVTLTGMLTSSSMLKSQSDTTGGLTSSTYSTTDDKLKSATPSGPAISAI